MISSTSITLDLQSPNIAVVAAAKQNDSMSREIVATLKNGSDPFTPPGNAMVMIRYSKPDRTAGWYDTMEDETTSAYSITGNVVTILLCEQMLTVPGNVYVEINFYTQTERLSTFSFLLKVEKSVLSDSEIVSSDYYNVLSQKINALLGATTNPPQIDPTSKHWMLWNEDHGQYEDSGYSSVGTRGPTGPQGVSIASTSKASGTGAPGTTDTYNVNLSNNTVAGTFTVYNGMNGTGSVNSVNGTYPDQTGNVEVDIPASVYVGPSAPSDPDINIWFDTDDPGQSVVNSVNGKSGVVTLFGKGSIVFSTSWTSGTGEYTQTVTVSGVTVTTYSMVNLQPNTTALTQLMNDGVSALFIENNSGTLVAHAVGKAPTEAMTIQCLVMEV